MTNELLQNLEKLHTTELGVIRIKRNLGLITDDVISWCKNTILTAAKNIENEESGRSNKTCETVCNKKTRNENSQTSINKIFRKGKNYYIKTNGYTITVNAYSCTVITAHKEKSHTNNEHYCNAR